MLSRIVSSISDRIARRAEVAIELDDARSRAHFESLASDYVGEAERALEAARLELQYRQKEVASAAERWPEER